MSTTSADNLGGAIASRPVALAAGRGANRRAISLGKKCLFAFIPLTALLLFVEAAARLLAPAPHDAQRFQQIEQIIVYLGNKPGESIFEPDPACFWRLKPNVTLPTDRGQAWGGKMSNSHGLRSRDVSIEEAFKRQRVLCFGDSSTFAFGVGFDSAWPNQLQELFDADRPGEFEVLNAGIPGQTTYQGRQRLTRELEKWKPQVAVITFGNNDGWRWDGLTDREHARRTSAVQGLQFLNHSRAWQVLQASCRQSQAMRSTQDQLAWAQQATWNYFDPNSKWTPRVSLDDFADNLQAMIDECHRCGCRPILVVWPDQRQLLGQPTWRPPYQAAMRQVASRAGVECLDLVPLFEDAGDWASERFIPNDVVHLDHEGNLFVSQAVKKRLEIKRNSTSL